MATKSKKSKKSVVIEVEEPVDAVGSLEEEMAAAPETAVDVEEAKPRASVEIKETIDEKIVRIMAKMLPEMGAMIGMGIAKAQADATTAVANARDAARMTGERCQDCRQFLPPGTKQGQHKHRMIAVFPINPRNGQWFQGVRINGVLYLSNNHNHRIPVPADAAIEQLIELWERQEDENLTGRQKEWNSGSIGPGGMDGFRQADARAGLH